MNSIFATMIFVALQAPAQPAPAPTSGLSVVQQTQLNALFAEEICPCKCASSFAQCMGENKCKPASILAKWAERQMSLGMPIESIATALNAEVAAFSSKKARISTEGYHGKKGPGDAKFTMVEFADFECTHCKAASVPVRELLQKRKDVRVVYKHFPLSFHAMAKPAAMAAEAAGEQGRFWEMHDAIFATQTMLDNDLFVGHAKALGLDSQRFMSAMKSPENAAKVDASLAEGISLKIEATPSFFINGRSFHLNRSVEGFETRLNMEAARKSSKCK